MNLPQNMHIHTAFSDGYLPAEAVIKNAKEQKMGIIGITDHYITTKIHDPRYYVTNLPRYTDHLRLLRKQYQTAGFQIRIGIEIDCSIRNRVNFEGFDFAALNQLDYVLLEYVKETVDFPGCSLDEIGDKIISKLQIPMGLAHNHLTRNFQLNSDLDFERFAEKINQYHLFIELNEGESGHNMNNETGRYYFEEFPPAFWECLKRNGIKFSIGTDNHEGEPYGDSKKAQKLVQTHGLTLFPF